MYLILCRDLPFSLSFIAHQIILSQYYELALILEVLVNLGKNWMDAGNKLMSKRYCIKATMIIVGAFIVAHFLDKSFYTIQSSSTNANIAAALFSFTMRGFLFVMSLVSAIKIYRTIKREPFLNLNCRICYLHVGILGIEFFFQGLYELCFILWVHDKSNTLTHS